MKKELLERYSRQIIIKDIGALGQKKISSSKILIIGAGGLGCPVADLLSRAGVGEIGIVDTYGSMYGNGSTPVTKDGVELDDEVLVVDNFNDRAILAEVVIALKELKAENDSLKSRIAALESS